MPIKLFSEKNGFHKLFKIPLLHLAKTHLNLIVPYYHMVSNDEVLHIKWLYSHKNIKQFKDDLDFLLRNFNPISLFDFIEFLKHGRLLPKRALLMTFDDGFREMHDIVAPLLLEKGIPATFFINSNFTDNKHMCYQNKASILADSLKKIMSLSVLESIKAVFFKHNLNTIDIKNDILSINYQQKEIIDEIAQLMEVDFKEYLIKTAPYMTTGHIKELIKKGFTIGAHSIDHPLYSSLSLEDQLFQTLESIKFVRERFRLDYGAFAFPQNDNGVSEKFFADVYQSGLIDITFGTEGMKNDSVSSNIHRFCLDNPLGTAEESMALGFARYIKRAINCDNNIIRQ